MKRINAVLQLAVPQLDELQLRHDDDGTPHLEARYEHWRESVGLDEVLVLSPTPDDTIAELASEIDDVRRPQTRRHGSRSTRIMTTRPDETLCGPATIPMAPRPRGWSDQRVMWVVSSA